MRRSLRRGGGDEGGPVVLHFTSGPFRRAEGLMFSDAAGHTTMASGAELGGLLRTYSDDVRVVVLNACDCAYQLEAIRSVIDCVVVMSPSASQQGEAGTPSLDDPDLDDVSR